MSKKGFDITGSVHVMLTDMQVIILGFPAKPSYPGGEEHDCDKMGCGSINGHVIGRYLANSDMRNLYMKLLGDTIEKTCMNCFHRDRVFRRDLNPVCMICSDKKLWNESDEYYNQLLEKHNEMIGDDTSSHCLHYRPYLPSDNPPAPGVADCSGDGHYECGGCYYLNAKESGEEKKQ